MYMRYVCTYKQNVRGALRTWRALAPPFHWSALLESFRLAMRSNYPHGTWRRVASWEALLVRLLHDHLASISPARQLT